MRPRGQEAADGGLVAHEDDVDARACGLQRAPHDRVGRVVTAGRVDHDAHGAVAAPLQAAVTS